MTRGDRHRVQRRTATIGLGERQRGLGGHRLDTCEQRCVRLGAGVPAHAHDGMGADPGTLRKGGDGQAVGHRQRTDAVGAHGGDLPSRPGVGVADEIGGDLPDALDTAGDDDEQFVVVRGRRGGHPQHGADRYVRQRGTSGRDVRRHDLRGFRNGGQQQRGHRLRHDRIEPQGANHRGMAQVDAGAPGAIQQIGGGGGFAAHGDQHAVPFAQVARRCSGDDGGELGTDVIAHRPLTVGQRRRKVRWGVGNADHGSTQRAVDRLLRDDPGFRRGTGDQPGRGEVEHRVHAVVDAHVHRAAVADQQYRCVAGIPGRPQDCQHGHDCDGHHREHRPDDQRDRLSGKRIVEHPGVAAHQRMFGAPHQEPVSADL